MFTQKIDERYVLKQLLGSGATSQVFRAWDDLMQREVAVKVFGGISAASVDDALREPALKSIVKEAKAASALHHRNIAALYAAGVSDSIHGEPIGNGGLRTCHPYLVGELVIGETLHSLIHSSGAKLLAGPEALDILSQCCSAIRYMHRKGVLHRDIKPTNIMIGKDTNGNLVAKLIDLGLSKRLSSIGSQLETQTRAGLTSGTPGYMSPEQCFGKTIDERTDVFALGACLYEAVTGVAAFTGPSQQELMALTITEDPASFQTVCPQLALPQRLEDIVFTAISRDSQTRYQTVEELQLDLDALRESLRLGIALPPASAVGRAQRAKSAASSNGAQLPASGEDRSSRGRLVFGSVAVCVLLCLVLLIGFGQLENVKLQTAEREVAALDSDSTASTHSVLAGHERLGNLYLQAYKVSRIGEFQQKAAVQFDTCLRISIRQDTPGRYFEAGKYLIKLQSVLPGFHSSAKPESVLGGLADYSKTLDDGHIPNTIAHADTVVALSSLPDVADVSAISALDSTLLQVRALPDTKDNAQCLRKLEMAIIDRGLRACANGNIHGSVGELIRITQKYGTSDQSTAIIATRAAADYCAFMQYKDALPWLKYACSIWDRLPPCGYAACAYQLMADCQKEQDDSSAASIYGKKAAIAKTATQGDENQRQAEAV